MFSFMVSQVKNGCRLGVIEVADNVQIETPMCMLYTRAGSVPSLTRDMVDRLENPPKIVHMPLPLLADHHESVKEFGKGIKAFCGLDGFLVYCSVQDPAVSCPSGYNDKTGVSVWGRAGRSKLDVDLFSRIMEAFQPDFCQVIGDNDTDEQSTKKRLKKSHERTKSFLETYLNKIESSDNSKRPVVFGTSTGGFDKEERLKSTEYLQESNLNGTVFEGFHNFGPETEKFDFTRVKTMLTEVNDSVTKDSKKKLNIWHGIMTPMNIMHAVEAGIDVFDSSFAHIVTERGGALVFNYEPTNKKAAETQTELDLKDKKYSDDLTPILDNCTCYTCKNHTRAYICHLLNTSELLAAILLNMHNFHHYFRFFEALRQSLQNNTYSDFRTLIESQYPSES